MNMFRTTLVLAIAGLPLLSGGCSQQQASPAADSAEAAKPEAREPQTMIGRTVEKEIAKARKELHDGNIPIGGKGVDASINGRHYAGKDDDRPRAEITPNGDLLVDGKAVAVTPQQRAMLLEYRGQIIAIADAGMTLGSKGAELAGKAIGESLGALFSGNTDEIEKRVEAEASKIEAEAKLLCKQMPPLLATQQKLAASLPQFKPYATMTKEDVDDCADDIDHKGVWSTQ